MKMLLVSTVLKPLALGLVTGALIYTVGSAIDIKQDQQAQQKEYCEMVQLNIDTGGKTGWPDYRGVYLKDCDNE